MTLSCANPENSVEGSDNVYLVINVFHRGSYHMFFERKNVKKKNYHSF